MSTLITSMTRSPAGVDPWPRLETFMPSLVATQGNLGQNLTYFRRIPARNTSLPYTTTKVFNGGTVNGNYAVGLWTTYDGLTLHRIGGTASTAQSGATAVQSAALSATIYNPPGLPLWISFSEDSATGTYSRLTGWSGTLITDADCRTTNVYNQTADILFSSLNATTTIPWAQII